MARMNEDEADQGALREAPMAQTLPSHVGHRERLRDRFRSGGADAMPDYELLELILFNALPQRRHQAAGQGS